MNTNDRDVRDVREVKAVINEQTMYFAPKVYSTGRHGYIAVGKIVIGGKRYQCNYQMYELGQSKG